MRGNRGKCVALASAKSKDLGQSVKAVLSASGVTSVERSNTIYFLDEEG